MTKNILTYQELLEKAELATKIEEILSIINYFNANKEHYTDTQLNFSEKYLSKIATDMFNEKNYTKEDIIKAITNQNKNDILDNIHNS